MKKRTSPALSDQALASLLRYAKQVGAEPNAALAALLMKASTASNQLTEADAPRIQNALAQLTEDERDEDEQKTANPRVAANAETSPLMVRRWAQLPSNIEAKDEPRTKGTASRTTAPSRRVAIGNDGRIGWKPRGG